MNKFIELDEDNIIDISKVLVIEKIYIRLCPGINVYFQGEEKPHSIFFLTLAEREEVFNSLKEKLQISKEKREEDANV